MISGLEGGRGGWVVTANLDHLRRLVRQPSYADLCSRADLIVADGRPLLWAARLQGTPLPGQVAGSNLIHSLTAAAARAGRSVFFLGGEPGTAEAAAKLLAQRNPGLRVAGTDCPPMGFDKAPASVERVRRMLLEARPDIIYVALGSPKQEELIDRFRQAGTLPGAWWVGVGISFSFVCGQVARAPQWMQVCGLEWVHRLAQEPRRLFKRYIVQGIPFALVLFGSALAYRFRGRGRDRRNDGGTAATPCAREDAPGGSGRAQA